MDKIKDIRHFQSASMNLDDDARVLDPNEHRELLNSIIAVAESDHVSCLQNIKGTSNIFDLSINTGLNVPDGLRAIGCCEDVEENALVLFLCDIVSGVNHSIMRYFIKDSRCEWILKSEPLLNFKYNYLVNSANRIGDLLYWTDGYFGSYLNNDFNPPRKININKAINYTASYPDRWEFTRVEKYIITSISGVQSFVTNFVGPILFNTPVGSPVISWCVDGINHYGNSTGYGTIILKTWTGSNYNVITDRPWQEDTITTKTISGYILPYAPEQYFGIDWQVLDVIKWKPCVSPTMEYKSNTLIDSNQIHGKQYQFGYVHIFDDNEISVMSPISNIINPVELANYHATFNILDIDYNYITVGVNTGSTEVKKIIIYVKEGNIGAWKELKQIYKYNNDGDYLVNSDIIYTYDFYGNEFLSGADQINLSRPFDFVPPVVKHQDLIEKNRLVYSNYQENYDNVDVDVSLIRETETVGDIGTNISEWITTFELIQSSSVLQTGSHDTRYFYAGVIDLTNFWEAGYDYNIIIQCYPYTYEPRYDYISYPETYPAPYYGKLINSSVTVQSEYGDTIENFLNEVVLSLRTENYNSLVIALNYYAYKGLDGVYGNFSREWPEPKHAPICEGNELAFLFEDFPVENLYDLSKSAYFPSVKISVEKIQKRNIYTTWKSGETKLFGIAYYDEQGRVGSVNTSNDSSIYIPSLIEFPSSRTIYKNNILWEVNHIPPYWAKYWRWMYADLNHFYLYAVISDIRILDPSLGYIFININEFIELESKVSKKFVVKTYKWQDGDRMRFVFNKTVSGWMTIVGGPDMEIICENIPGDPYAANAYKLDSNGDPIWDSDGNKIPDTGKGGIIVRGFEYSLYGIDRYKTVIEIYRPSAPSDEPIYYEYSDRMEILDPHTDNRRHKGTKQDQIYSTTIGVSNTPASGDFELGDAWITSRLTTVSFPVERRNYSDYYESSSLNIGLPNIENRNMRFQKFISNNRWGGLYLENTQINELSKFLGEDYIALPEKFGPINYIKEIGFTLKVIQKYKPSSIYVGRQGLTQADVKRGEVLYASSNTLGTVTTSESNYGTEHTESCIKHEGNLYYYDINSGCIVRDSGNGIRSISQQEDGDGKTTYKVKTLMQTKSRTFQNHTVNVFAAYDGRYDIVYFCFVDHTDQSESFTIGFHEPSNKWVSFYSFIPDYIGSMKMATVSWKLGSLWLHDVGTRMNFYGVQYGQTVKTVSNAQPLSKKRFLSITENSNKIWDLANQGDVYIPPDETYKRGQTSLVKYGAFQDLEGTIYAAFGKNMTTHSISPTNDDYINGDDLRGNYVELTLNNASTDEVNLFAIEVQSIISNP